MNCCWCVNQDRLLAICGLKSRVGSNDVGTREKPTLKMLPAPRSSSATTSKTGNAKVALGRGRSLMDWIRLTSSRSTAAKLKDGVDHTELSKHSSVNNCWVLLGDKVYDVTEYLPFHPGGIDELMRAAGTDGTDLFSEYHAWVNYDTMLKSCFVGIFNGDRCKLRNAKLGAVTGEGTSSSTNEVDFETAEISAGSSSDGHLRVRCSKWQQLRDENVSVEFREKIIRLTLHFPSGTTQSLQWTNIPKTVFDEPFCVNVDDGAISVRCKVDNVDSDNIIHQWSSGKCYFKPDLKYRKCKICEIQCITHDTYSFALQMPSFCRMMVPIGHHVMLRICIRGSLIERPYTPVLISRDGRFISFMIKFYENGIFTPKLRDKKCGDFIEISDALGCFDVWSDCTDNALLLAAGTGLSPMLRLAASRLESSKATTILLFNKKAVDIVPDEYFKKCNIPLDHPLLKIIHCLSEPEANWDGERGLISKQLVLKYLDENLTHTAYRILICGPDPFVTLAAKLLDELGIPPRSVHIFQG